MALEQRLAIGLLAVVGLTALTIPLLRWRDQVLSEDRLG
jgi:hypothetical protein